MTGIQTCALPILVGDVVSLERGPCPHCGRTGDRIVGPVVRSKDLVKVKGMLVNPDLMVQALEAELGTRAFQVVITTVDPQVPLSGDVLLLRVAGTAEPALASRLALRVKDAVGVTPGVEFVDAQTLVDQSVSWKTKKLVDLRAVPPG